MRQKQPTPGQIFDLSRWLTVYSRDSEQKTLSTRYWDPRRFSVRLPISFPSSGWWRVQPVFCQAWVILFMAKVCQDRADTRSTRAQFTAGDRGVTFFLFLTKLFNAITCHFGWLSTFLGEKPIRQYGCVSHSGDWILLTSLTGLYHIQSDPQNSARVSIKFYEGKKYSDVFRVRDKYYIWGQGYGGVMAPPRQLYFLPRPTQFRLVPTVLPLIYKEILQNADPCKLTHKRQKTLELGRMCSD